MALLNEIKKMQGEGKTEQEIISSLREQGISPREIVEALSQSKIKKAVGGESAPEPIAAPQPQKYQGVEQEALMPQQAQATQKAYPDEMPPAEQPAEYVPSRQNMVEQKATYPAQPSQQQEAYPEYQQYPQQYSQGAGISSDTITEIAEQVVSEKLSTIKKNVESLEDLKNTMGTKLSLLEDRLKRMESIIDRLNLSILQKVGDYMTNINDIKKELIETQKSFKALNPSLNLTKEKPAREKSKTQKQPLQPKEE